MRVDKLDMKKTFIIIIVIVILGGVLYLSKGFFADKEDVLDNSGATAEAIAEIASYNYSETFTSMGKDFSFKYPASFTVQVVPQDSGEVILVQDIKTSIGAQIVITPFEGGDIDITPELIRESVPDMEVSDPQEVLIGVNRKGLAFKSDNESFGGKSRDVWFVYKGKLYQITTYEELDEFLKGVFSTWSFH
jgi:hypothetical protein